MTVLCSSSRMAAPGPREVFDRRTGGLSRQCREIRAKLKQLKLSNKKVWDREHDREARGEGVDTPWFVKVRWGSCAWGTTHGREGCCCCSQCRLVGVAIFALISFCGC